MDGQVNVEAVMDAAPSVTVAGVTVTHNTKPWSVETNRHPKTSGRSWGWIEGAPGNVCWSDDKKFNRQAAGEMVSVHAIWLEDQKPISIRLVEARERYAKAKSPHEAAREKYDRTGEELTASEELIAKLASAEVAKPLTQEPSP